MQILKYVDVLIGLSLIMVLASTVVTALTQILTTSTFARSRYLRDGLAGLIGQLEPSLDQHARYIAELVLRHPMIARPNSALGFFTSRVRNWGRQSPQLAVFRKWLPQVFGSGLLPNTNPATVIQREELIRVLLEWAAGQGPLAEFATREGASQQARDAMAAVVAAVKNNEVPKPDETLEAIRKQALLEEQANPNLRAAEWHGRAILSASVNEFTAKLFSWYDNTIQRISEHFTLEAKLWTSLVALIVVLAIQLDSVQLLKRLSVDDAYRQSLLDQAKELDTRLDSTARTVTDPKSLEEIRTRIEEQRDQIDRSLAAMRSPALSVIPDHLVWQSVEQLRFNPQEHNVNDGSRHTLKLRTGAAETAVTFSGDPLNQIRVGLATDPQVRTYADKGVLRIAAASAATGAMTLNLDGRDIAASYRQRDLGGIWTGAPGLLLSWVLLSLGAPFWYDALKNLLKFRSLVAQKDDKDREVRAGTKPAPAAEPTKSRGAAAGAGS
jgi:hypothetical protein